MAQGLDGDFCCGGSLTEDAAPAASTKPVFSVEQAAAQILRNDEIWSNTTLTYSFYDFCPYAGEADGFTAMTAEQQAATREALQLWSDVSGLTFVETAAGTGTLGFGTSTSTFSNACGLASGYAYGPGTGIRATTTRTSVTARSITKPMPFIIKIRTNTR